MKATVLALLTFATVPATPATAQSAYPPLQDYVMPQEAEITLARTAAPASVTAKATIKVLTSAGYRIVHSGENGFTCLVMRGWSAPTYTPQPFRDFVYDATIRAPICFDAVATRSVLPYYELRSALGIAGKTPAQIADAVQAAYATGQLPRREASFAYMWSAEQMLGRGIGSWRPHIMVFLPYYDNTMVGGNAFGSPLPQLSDDAATPFSVVVIPVDSGLAIRLP